MCHTYVTAAIYGLSQPRLWLFAEAVAPPICESGLENSSNWPWHNIAYMQDETFWEYDSILPTYRRKLESTNFCRHLTQNSYGSSKEQCWRHKETTDISCIAQFVTHQNAWPKKRIKVLKIESHQPLEFGLENWATLVHVQVQTVGESDSISPRYPRKLKIT